MGKLLEELLDDSDGKTKRLLEMTEEERRREREGFSAAFKIWMRNMR